MVRTTAVVISLAALASACSVPPAGAPVLVVANRSDATLALYPTAIIRPCSTLELDQAGIDAGQAALAKAGEADGDFDAWVPDGAIQFGQEIPPRRTNATAPITVVISSLPIRAVEADVPTAELPPCGGAPRGIGE